MAKKPKVEIKSDKVNEALKATCKDLYFSFLTIAAIHKKTGVATREIHKWIYGDAGFQDVDRSSWHYERDQVTEEESKEYRARNRYLTMILHSQAIEDTVNSMKLLRDRVNKKGAAVPLSPFELEKLTANILNIQKINQVADLMRPPVSQGELPAPKSTAEEYEVIDMAAVAFAITKDKGIMKLINGGLNEKEFTEERKHAGSGIIDTTEKFRAKASGNARATRQAASGKRKPEIADQKPNAGSTDSRRSEPVQKAVHASQPRRPASDSDDKPAVDRHTESRDIDQPSSQQDRDFEPADRSDTEFDDTGSDLSEDGFADEYS